MPSRLSSQLTHTDPVATPDLVLAQQMMMKDPASEFNVRRAHAAIMSVTFIVLMPLGALLVYLPAGNQTIRYLHAPFQLFAAAAAVAGLILGVILAHQNHNEYTGYHPIIGYVVVGLVVLIQPALGLVQHLLFRRQGRKTIFGVTHRWLGRIIIILGMINGGLGFMFSGSVGGKNVPEWGVIVYSVAAGVVAIFYVAVVLWQSTKHRNGDPITEKEGERDTSRIAEPRFSEHTMVTSEGEQSVKVSEDLPLSGGVTGHGITNNNRNDNATNVTPVHNYVTG